MKLTLIALPFLALASPAPAQQADRPAAAAPGDAPLCTDRPTKSYVYVGLSTRF